MTNFLFLAVPLACLLCNIFLFLAVLSTKKSKLINSFLLLLGCFVLWTAGSLFMRVSLYPGMLFWYYVSVTGIFCAPFCIYNFFYFYTNQKANFSRILWLITWLIVVALNFRDTFIANQDIEVVNGVFIFDYTITPLALVPILLAALTLCGVAGMIYRSIHSGTPRSVFTPVLIGLLIMFLGLICMALFKTTWLSSDTIFCGVNAIFLYYALYKKRILTLTPIASNYPIYLMSIVFTTLIGVFSYGQVSEFFDLQFPQFGENRVLLFALLFSVLTIASFAVLQLLTSKLFVKGQETREKELARLTNEMTSSLDLDATVQMFKDFLLQNAGMELAYILLLDESKKQFKISACSQDVRQKTFTLSVDSPLVAWLEEHRQSITYHDFARTRNFRSMWESEKTDITALGIELIIPVAGEGALTGLVLLTKKVRNSGYSSREISFLESAASIVAIAFKNASLYAEMQNEARRDTLTGLYNRSYFLRQVQEDFRVARDDKFTLLMVSLDDFRLFNELYSTSEGDVMLRTMGDILTKITDTRGTVARYGGKEFMVSLPYCDSKTAESIAAESRKLLDSYLTNETQKTRRMLTFSAGICSFPAAASNLDDVVSYTNMAVYSAKKNGKNTTFVYAGQRSSQGEDVEEAAEAKRKLRENCASTIFALTAAIDAKDHYTFKHSNNVSSYAATLAEAIGLDNEHVEIIRQAGLLHDIGKIGIPEAILGKTSKLTDEEYTIMKQHVEGSISMIRHLPSLDYVIPAAIGHHERWDGKGYPRGIAGENIPIGARCLGLADAFDAMTTARSYRDRLPVEHALEEMEKNLGTQFDPQLGRTFIELVKAGKITVL
ncbi:MAG: diguanylate cyclase [Oscillospiraceae bacterium]